jgi:hypothetical protein
MHAVRAIHGPCLLGPSEPKPRFGSTDVGVAPATRKGV